MASAQEVICEHIVRPSHLKAESGASGSSASCKGDPPTRVEFASAVVEAGEAAWYLL